MYLYRAIDQFGQVIDVLVAQRRDLAAPGDSLPVPCNTRRRRVRSPLITRLPTRGHYELGAEETVNLRVPAAFDELVMAI